MVRKGRISNLRRKKVVLLSVGCSRQSREGNDRIGQEKRKTSAAPGPVFLLPHFLLLRWRHGTLAVVKLPSAKAKGNSSAGDGNYCSDYFSAWNKLLLRCFRETPGVHVLRRTADGVLNVSTAEYFFIARQSRNRKRIHFVWQLCSNVALSQNAQQRGL